MKNAPKELHVRVPRAETMTEIDIDALDGVELGKAVAVEVMGWFDAEANNGTPLRYPFITLRGDQLYVTAEHGPSREWHPWSDLRAAGEVLDKMRADRWQCSMDVYATRSWCTFDKEEGQEFRSIADNLPTAICRAALKAVRGEREG